MQENIPDWKVERAIDRLVAEGKVIRTTVNGEPSVKLTKAGKEAIKKHSAPQATQAK